MLAAVSAPIPEPLNVWDYERLAAERLDEATYAYFAGGANDEWTLRDNVEAFRRWQLRPRVLVDVAEPSAATTVLGHEVALPVLVAPTAYHRGAHPDGEAGMARAANAAGTIMCLSTFSTTAPAEVIATGAACWYQLYVPRHDGLARDVIAQARESGFRALLLTVDAPVLGRRERDRRAGFRIPYDVAHPALGRAEVTPHGVFDLISPSVTWREIEHFASLAELPVVVKGVLTAEDAALACEHGAAGLVVSNHGGRQLDGVAATIDALPEVVEAVDGRIEVLLDGGVRRGTDVLKALALGARAVLVGRPALWGLTVGGEAGARRVLELLHDEIEMALQLVGCRTPAELTRTHVGRSLAQPRELR
jgi:isopentenyl diphosphate isomerase/L-lactate dehydrogenase-like FMN-dependent dehydrogenase